MPVGTTTKATSHSAMGAMSNQPSRPGRRWTGWAFVIFVTSSLALIGWGFLQPDSEGIGWQNIALLCINCVGVYRYLILKEKPGEPAGQGGAD